MGRYHFVEGIALADCAMDVEGADLALKDVVIDHLPEIYRRFVINTCQVGE